MARDKCIICGDITLFDFDTPIDSRVYYVEGAGQLCEDCWHNAGSSEDSFFIKVPTHYVKRYSNDQELGQKVRELFHKNK